MCAYHWGKVYVSMYLSGCMFNSIVQLLDDGIVLSYIDAFRLVALMMVVHMIIYQPPPYAQSQWHLRTLLITFYKHTFNT